MTAYTLFKVLLRLQPLVLISERESTHRDKPVLQCTPWDPDQDTGRVSELTVHACVVSLCLTSSLSILHHYTELKVGKSNFPL